MSEWYKNSQETVFRIYGEIFDTRFSKVFLLQTYNKRYPHTDDLDHLNTCMIYNIGAFLFFKDEVSLIIINGEKNPLSLYFYFISAIISIGDAIDTMRKIRKLIVNSNVRNPKKDSKATLLDDLRNIDDEYCSYDLPPINRTRS